MTSSAEGTGIETYDDRLAALADEMPGFGGFFWDRGGRLKIMLTDEGRLDEYRPKLRAFLAPQERRDPEASEWAARVDQGLPAAADYDFRQLYDWKRKLATQIWSIDGVTMSDLDEARNRVVIGVSDEVLRSRIVQVASELGVPSEAVIVEQFDPPQVASAPARSLVTWNLSQRVRPVVGGVELETTTPSCTLGYNVAHLVDGNYQDEYFVTASHCTTNNFGVQGDLRAWQGSKFISADKIGTEVVDPPTFTNSTDSECPVGRECRYSDAAAFKYDPGVSFAHGLLAWPNSGGSKNFSLLRPVEFVGLPTVGATVQVVGQTSGRRSGSISSTCVDFNQLLPGESGSGRLMLCQIEAGIVVDGGDSGAPVVRDIGGTLYHMGLLWGRGGGKAYFSMMWMSELATALGPGHSLSPVASAGPPAPPPALTATIGGPSSVPEDSFCTWQGFGGGGTPPYGFSWSGVLSGSGATKRGTVNNSGWLNLTITDAAQATADAQLWVVVDNGADECLE